MYQVRQVGKVFDGDTLALDGVTLDVARGEHVAVIGPSGAGKTTLFRILNLALRPTSGTLRFDGVDVATLSDAALRRARTRIGTIYQQQNLVGRLRVVHNVLAGNLGRWSTGGALASLLRPRGVDVAGAALARVGIADKLYARTDQLSGGQQQRVAIARVLVQDPDVVLADEPVASVDPALAVSLLTLLRDLSAESRKTLLVNLHSVDLALAFFPRIVGVRAGRVAFDLPADQVTVDLLEALYAGDQDADAAFERLANGYHPFGRACRPLSGFRP
jgi:phosphonate transport system ATP-binding protein